MKNLLLVFAILLSSQLAFSQVNFGFKAGVNTFNVNDEILSGDINNFTLSVREAQYGFHAGVFLRAKLGPILVQPEVVFNSDNIDYTFDQGQLGQTIINQKYRAIDLPVLTGFKLGPLRVLAGPVGHYQLESITEFTDDIRTEAFADKLSLGWQIGGGFDIKKITFDLRYESNDSKLGESLNIFGQSVQFAQTRNRVVASIGYKF
jgi:opacity protein-like surface antigen